MNILQDRVRSLSPASHQEEEHAFKQAYQEIALYALSRADFFRAAAFQGGTCLRLLYGLRRFSEDLDFVVKEPNSQFVWEPFLKNMTETFASYGILLKTVDRSKLPGVVQRAFLKQDSFGKMLRFSSSKSKQHLTIRLEVDTNPPDGSGYTIGHLDFPIPFSLAAQDKPSLFASKCHALLCRNFVKGRDWYDFLWYVGKTTPINLILLKSALLQTNHWNLPLDAPCTKQVLCDRLRDRIALIDWKQAAEDVVPFVPPQDAQTIRTWDKSLFAAYVDKLSEYLG